MELKPFNLEAAKDGAPVVTRDGRKVRIVCFDKVGLYTIVALVLSKDESSEAVFTFTDEGCHLEEDTNDKIDLFMAPTKYIRWINVYRVNDTYKFGEFRETEQEATKIACNYPGYICTRKIEWED